MASIRDSPTSRFEYYRGYPARLRRDEISSRRGAWGCLGPFLLASLVGTGAAVYGLSEHPRWGELLRLAGLAGFTLYFSCLLWEAWYVARHTGIVPYFQERLGDIHTFARGQAIAKTCQALDELAVKLRLAPLSALGFNDDFAGEELTWHPPEQGLATVGGLLRALRANRHALLDQARVVEELESIEQALRKACDRNVPFCFLLYTAGGTNAMEWEQRKGSCF